MKRSLFALSLAMIAFNATPVWSLDSSSCVQMGADSGLPRGQGLRLCRESQSTAPVKCFLKAHGANGLNVEDSIQLCQCAQDERAISCINEYIHHLHKGVQEALLTCDDPTLKTLSERQCMEANEPTG